MNGNEIYDKNFKNKINCLINSNSDKQYLRGFYNFINKSSSTSYNYLLYVVAFINYTKQDIEKLTIDDYTNYLASIDNKTQSYKIAVYSALKKFSLYLKASKRNTDDPMQFVERPKFYEEESTKQKREIGYLTTKEIHKYIKNIDTGVGNARAISRQKKWKNRDKLIILLLLTTGMRCSALYKLDIDNINIEEKTVYVIDKGRKYKKYDVPDEVISIAIDWLKDRYKYVYDKNNKALFVSGTGERISQCSISRIVNKYFQGINSEKNITPHKLRATYGTQLYSKTGNLYMVQECMGHNSPKTTELYIRGQKNEVSKTASDIMSKLLF